jgi:lipoprotein-releasing system permease protein
MFLDGEDSETAIPDTAYLKVTVSGNRFVPCYPSKLDGNEFVRNYLNDDGTKFSVDLKNGKKVTFEYIDGKGSHQNYIGGLEILVNKWEDLDNITRDIKRTLIYTGDESMQDVRVNSIKEDQAEIFLWLSFLDLNVIVILVLMILVSTINMGSGLLVLIITKTSMIGLLKALGAKNWSIRKIFLYQVSFIILKGMVIGNIIGIGLCYLQLNYNLIPLNSEVYYLNTVPIEINYLHIILLNLGTLILCTAALIIPSYAVTKISPVKAIKFD